MFHTFVAAALNTLTRKAHAFVAGAIGLHVEPNAFVASAKHVYTRSRKHSFPALIKKVVPRAKTRLQAVANAFSRGRRSRSQEVTNAFSRGH